MPQIHLLDDNTANRIAAGEVVERPASVVKELVENAIDSGATDIRVRLEEGGRRLIEVADNGCGMTSDEAVLSLQRHATSKITCSDDLFAIRTLGFRGEALPSIASVSRFTILTLPLGASEGALIEVQGGDIHSVGVSAAAPGTVMTVRDLFYNTPARLKFLKSPLTEMQRITEAVGGLAIAHPHVAISVTEGGVRRLCAPGGGDALGVFAAVWGRDIAKRLVPICETGPHLQVSGFICPPDITRPGRSHELFFVNNRPIKSRLLGHAVEAALRELTPESRYPIAAVMIAISPDMVDVNVHPTKSEIKFTQDGAVHHAVSSAVKRAMLQYGIVPTMMHHSNGPANPVALTNQISPSGLAGAYAGLHQAAADLFGSQIGPFGAHQESTYQASPVEWSSSVSDLKSEYDAQGHPPPDAQGFAPPESDRKPFAEQLRGFRVVGQIRNTYIIAETDQGLAIIDQHVAHERVLYERLTEKRQEHGPSSQRLVVPFTLHLSQSEAAMVCTRMADFAAAGWELESFGREAFLVRSVPSYATRKQPEALLKDIIDELVHQSVARRLIVQRDHVTITNACKMAVKAGDALNIAEMEGLLQQLADTVNPYVCPHGRPIVVTVAVGELDRKFKR